VVVRPLTPDERAEVHAEGGLVVEQAGGAAAKAGIESGDVILAVNNHPVKSAQELRRAVEKSGDVVALLVQRNDTKIYVPVDLG
jgi:serine protease Do